jgi:hypothetical protein
MHAESLEQRHVALSVDSDVLICLLTHRLLEVSRPDNGLLRFGRHVTTILTSFAHSKKITVALRRWHPCTDRHDKGATHALAALLLGRLHLFLG